MSCFDEWEWKEHFAGQPETERYLNHVVDKFDLATHIRFDTRVDIGGVRRRGRAAGRSAATTEPPSRRGFSSPRPACCRSPFFPDVPGRDTFQGESYHTGLWPKDPVDLKGKRVAMIGTGSSGVQLVPAIAGEVDRSPSTNATELVHAAEQRPITPEEQAELRADSSRSATPSTLHKRLSARPDDRRATSTTPGNNVSGIFEKVWNTPGFASCICNYIDLLLDPAANAEFCEFIADKIRERVDDPDTAEKLIPKDEASVRNGRRSRPGTTRRTTGRTCR